MQVNKQQKSIVADAAKLNKATKAADAGIDTLNETKAVTTVDVGK